MSESELKQEIVRLQSLVYRMALALSEYELDEADVDVKAMLEEAEAVAEQYAGKQIGPHEVKRPRLRVVG